MFEEEKHGEKLLPEGLYVMKVENATETVAKKTGSPMMKIIFSIDKVNTLGQTVSYTVVDYLTPASYRRKNQLCSCMGLDQYCVPNVDLPADALIGKTVSAFIKISKDESGQWPDKNQVHYYTDQKPDIQIKQVDKPKEKLSHKTEKSFDVFEPLNDEVPF